MQKYFEFIGLATFLLGLHLLLSNLYQPHLLYTQVVNGASVSAYQLPVFSERMPEIAFSFGLLLIGGLGIYTDIFRAPQRCEVT